MFDTEEFAFTDQGKEKSERREAQERSVFPTSAMRDEAAAMRAEPAAVPRGERVSRLSNRMVQLVSRYAGRGPSKSRVEISANSVLVVFKDLLTSAEQNLVDDGQTEAVKALRHRLHDLMTEEATRLVEQEVGRTVTSYQRDCDPEANCAVVVFVLDRSPGNGNVDVGDR